MPPPITFWLRSSDKEHMVPGRTRASMPWSWEAS